VRILPIARAKFLAGARFDLRVEALGLSDPNATNIRIEISGANGPETILVGQPLRSSSTPSSLEVTYANLNYPAPAATRLRRRSNALRLNRCARPLSMS